MKSIAKNYLVFTVLFFVVSAVTGAQQKTNKTEVVYDFEGSHILDQLQITSGVRISLTQSNVTNGKQALQINVPSFDETKDSYPRVIWSSNIFTSPADFSSYSKVSIDITNLGKGMLNIAFGMSNLPHFDVYGQMQGDKRQLIPAGATMTLNLDTSGLPRLDPSRIQSMMVLIAPGPVEQVIVIDNIRAEYDSIAGSPIDKLQKDVEQLKNQYSSIEQNLNFKTLSPDVQAEIKDAQKTAIAEIEQIAEFCSQVATGQKKGQFKEFSEKVNVMSNRLGKFVLMDKPVFYTWEINPYLNIFPDELPNFNNPSFEKTELALAGGEYRDIVFMVTANANTERNLQISCSTENSTLKDVTRIYEVIYLENRLGEYTGDAHCLLEGILKLPAGQSRQIRVGFDNRSTNLSPGTHNFYITIRDVEAKFEQVIPGTLRVWDFQLPGYDILPNNCYTELSQTPFANKQNILIPDMRASGYNVFYVHPMDLPRIKSFDRESGKIEFDTERFKNMMALIMKNWGPGIKPKFLFSISAFTDTSRPEDLFAQIRSKEAPVYPDSQWQAAFKEWVTNLRNLIEQLDLDYADWMITPADESSEYALRTVDIPLAELIKDVDPKIQLICNSSNINIFADAALSERYLKSFDIFQPHFGQDSEINYEHIELRKKNGKTIWLYRCLADLNVRSANIYDYYRLYIWDTLDLGAQGVGLWAYAENNRGSDDAWSMPNGGWSLIFQNIKQPDTFFYSRRYEVYREGRDDYRYVYALRDAARKTGRPSDLEEAEQIIKSATSDILANRFDFSRAEKWRQKIAEAIVEFSKK